MRGWLRLLIELAVFMAIWIPLGLVVEHFAFDTPWVMMCGYIVGSFALAVATIISGAATA